MGTLTNSDSSDADTRDPARDAVEATRVVVVEESDGEEKAKSKSQESADGKMRAIIEHINAHDDRSDDEEPSCVDDDFDFGDQVEDVGDESRKGDKGELGEGKENPNRQKHKGEEVEAQEEKAGANRVKKEVNEREVKDGGVKEKEGNDRASKAKKSKKDGAVKTIKKQTDVKTKPKAVRAKTATATKRKEAEKKGAAIKAKQPSSTDASPRDSPKASPKKASPKPKKAPPKTTAKGGAKGTAKSAVESVRDPKPKKTIAKPEKKTKKPLIKTPEKNGGEPKTFSKKAADPAKNVPTAKKSATKTRVERENLVKSENKTKKAKGKSRPISKSSEEEEEEEAVVVDSDVEDAPSADESDEEMADVAGTPATKHSYVGNLACSSRDPTCVALLDHAVQQLGKYNVVSYGTDSDCQLSAYIIGKNTRRGWGILQALVCGIPLVSDDWLSNSISEGKWKPMDMYRSDKFGQSPTSVDATAAVTHKIFDGQRVKVIAHEKDEGSVRKLLKICGARVAETRMDVIINDTGKPIKGCVNVTKKWLADSIETGMVLDYDAYIVGA